MEDYFIQLLKITYSKFSFHTERRFLFFEILLLIFTCFDFVFFGIPYYMTTLLFEMFFSVYQRIAFFKNCFYWMFSFCCFRHLATDCLLAKQNTFENKLYGLQTFEIVNEVRYRYRKFISVCKASNAEAIRTYLLGHIWDSESWLHIRS